MLTRARRRLRAAPADRGAATLALVLLGAFGALALVFMAVLPLLSGTEQSSRAQTAADAAALAGAEEMRLSLADTADLVRGLTPPGPDHAPLQIDLLVPSYERIQNAAGEYARRNGAELRQVSYDVSTGRVDVLVELDEPGAQGTDPARRRAAAEIGTNAGTCTISASEGELPPQPAPPADPPEDGEPEPEPEPPTEYSLSCTGGAAPDLDDVENFGAVVSALVGHLQDLLHSDAFEPRLTA